MDRDPDIKGGLFFLARKEDKRLNIDGYRPGDATVTATNSLGQITTLQVVVRASSAGPVARPPLTKLAPNSNSFQQPETRAGSSIRTISVMGAL